MPIRHPVGLVCLISLGLALESSTYASDPRPSLFRRSTAPARSEPADNSLLNLIHPTFRNAVHEVLQKPTLTSQAKEDSFTAHPQVYDWLVHHPDRTSKAWNRMNVPCVEIREVAGKRYTWTDGEGSDLTWQLVGQFTDGWVWYASGKVKPGSLLPTVPVKAVAILHAPREANLAGSARFKPSVKVAILTDSRAANALLRMVGPAGPRMAEQGAEQLLLFFSGVAAYIHEHPEKMEQLLAKPKE